MEQVLQMEEMCLSPECQKRHHYSALKHSELSVMMSEMVFMYIWEKEPQRGLRSTNDHRPQNDWVFVFGIRKRGKKVIVDLAACPLQELQWLVVAMVNVSLNKRTKNNSSHPSSLLKGYLLDLNAT